MGKTKQENLQRFKQYPKGSKLILQQVCDDCDILETQLIRDFKNKYIHRKDIGNEYFEGDYNEMIKDIHNKITNNVATSEDIDCEDDNILCNNEHEKDENEADYKLYIDDFDKWSKIHRFYDENVTNEYIQLTNSYNLKKNMEIKDTFNKNSRDKV